ncbi:MAG TPA: oligosaccharide flippase family protein, partial [Methylomirabilota bacterium]|nr:oligosaccharide flippase family protein [Methylomirabilota bacterium]
MIMGQGGAFLLLPLLSNHYSPEVIGEASFILTAATASAILLSLQFDQAVVVAPEPAVSKVLTFSLVWSAGLSLLAGIVLLLLDPIISRPTSLYALGIGLAFSTAWFNLLQGLFMRENRVGPVSLSRVVFYAGAPLAQILLARPGQGSALLFLEAQLGASVTAIVILLLVHRPPLARIGGLAGLRATWAEFRDYALFQAPAIFINNLSHQTPIFILSILFGPEASGLYFLAFRLVSAPTMLVSQAFGQVLFRDFAEESRKPNPNYLRLVSMLRAMLRLGPIAAAGGCLTLTFVLPLFLEPKWDPVAFYVVALIPSVGMTMVTSPVSPLVNLRGRQDASLRYNILLLIGRAIALICGAPFGPLGSMTAYALFSAVALGHFLLFIHGLFSDERSRFRRMITVELGSTLLMLLAFYLGQKSPAPQVATGAI